MKQELLNVKMEYQNSEMLLKQNGLKKTRLRLALLKQFKDTPFALSFADLKSILAKDTDKSTLYRNLPILKKSV